MLCWTPWYFWVYIHRLPYSNILLLFIQPSKTVTGKSRWLFFYDRPLNTWNHLRLAPCIALVYLRDTLESVENLLQRARCLFSLPVIFSLRFIASGRWFCSILTFLSQISTLFLLKFFSNADQPTRFITLHQIRGYDALPLLCLAAFNISLIGHVTSITSFTVRELACAGGRSKPQVNTKSINVCLCFCGVEVNKSFVASPGYTQEFYDAGGCLSPAISYTTGTIKNVSCTFWNYPTLCGIVVSPVFTPWATWGSLHVLPSGHQRVNYVCNYHDRAGSP